MQNIDWSKFVLKIYIKANMHAVYAAISTRAGLENWFLRKAAFTTPEGKVRADESSIEKGDTYEWLWHGHPNTTVEHGEVLEANGRDRFRFVFGKAGIVTIQLKEESGLTAMEITQENIPIDEESRMNYHVGCSTGWTFYLANIKSIMEGEHDLRNRNMGIKGVVNS